MLGQRNLLLIVSQLEICNIIILLNGWIIDAPILLLLFPLLLVLFNLFWRLLWFPGEELCADLPTQDTCLGPVPFLYAQCDLLENELCLLSSFHRPEGLDL